MLKPKDIYAHRPLPPVIGTDEWYEKRNLDYDSSDSETERISEIYSESDSDDHLPKDELKGSDTSYDIDFSSHATKPTASSTLHNGIENPDQETSSDESDEQPSLPTKTSLSNKSFAEELAAKLGNVVSEQENVPQLEVNKRPFQASNRFGDLFSDEPPPFVDQDGLIVPHTSTSSVKFSGEQGLFDDHEDELFWGQQKKTDQRTLKSDISKEDSNEDGPPPLQNYNTHIKFPKSSKISKGLFDSDDSSDDDIFSAAIKQPPKPSFLSSIIPVVPHFNEEPPELEDKTSKKEPSIKKPAGGISIFGTTNLFRDQNLSDVLKTPVSKNTKNIDNNTIKRTDQISSNISTQQTQERPNLFDEDEVDVDDQVWDVSKSNQFVNKKISPVLEKTNKSKDSIHSHNTNNKLEISAPQTIEVKESKPQLNTSSLFDNEVIADFLPQNLKKVSLFDDDDDLFKDELFASITTKFTSSLFDDDDDEQLFGITNKQNQLIEEISEPVQRILNSNVQTDISKSKVIVGQNKLFDEVDGFKPDTKREVVDESFGNKNQGKQEQSEDIPETINSDIEEQVSNSEIMVGHEELFDEAVGFKTDSNKKFDGDEELFDVTDDKNQVIEETSKNMPKIVSTNIQVDELDKSVIIVEQEGLFNECPGLKTDTRKVENATPKIKDVANNEETVGSKTKKKINLFSDTEEEDDLFTEFVPKYQDNEDSSKTIKRTLQINEIGIEISQDFGNIEIAADSTIEKSLDLKSSDNKELHFRLFGSTPPDDHYDWDNKSENISDTEEFASYHTDPTLEGTSYFDNQPPSLGPDDSSGIGRDHSTARIHSVDTSFNPYASSSRRFSSDIFSEQQSQDSLFVTKNKPESTTLSSNLGIIPESSKNSIFDITPSGNIEDFISTTDETPNNSIKNVDKEYQDEENYRLQIDEKREHASLLEVPDEISLGVEEDSENVENKIINDAPTSEVDGEMKQALIQTKAKSQIASITEMLKKEPNQDIPTEIRGFPGKLKHSLNINVSALKPGATQPKPKGIQKSRSLDLPQEHISEKISSPQISNKGKLDTSKKGISFEETIENVEVLPSITKDRVKISVKRRPSTRRGRQQAIDLSYGNTLKDVGTDENSPDSLQEDNVEIEAVTDLETKLQVETPQYTSLGTDEKSIPEKEGNESGTNNEQTPKAPFQPIISSKSIDLDQRTTNIFDENKDDVIFKTSSKKLKQKAKISLFDSEGESDGDLFGNTRRLKSDTGNRNPFKRDVTDKHTKSLFEESSSDDDLFSRSGGSNLKDSDCAKNIRRKSQSTIKKPVNIETEDDPLSDLLK